MKIGHSIDTNGFLTGDVLTGGTPDVTENCPNGFYKPKWSGVAWAEGLTQLEIDAIVNAPQLPDPDEELATAITNATTLDALKAALLGNGKLARVKGKMK